MMVVFVFVILPVPVFMVDAYLRGIAKLLSVLRGRR